MNANARLLVMIPLSALVICAESALAQTQQQDAERLRREGVERADAAARAQGMEQQRQLQERERQTEESRRSQSSSSTGGGYAPPHGGHTPSPSGGNSAGTGRDGLDYRALGKKMLRLPPLPADRNVLLGSWRLEGGGPRRGVAEFALTGKGATPGMGELMGMLTDLQSGKMLCDMSFGRGITFGPTTYSSGGAAGLAEGPIAYRSQEKRVIVAIPGDSRANPMVFDIAGPNRIVWGGTCALVRVGAPAANAAANTTAGNARTAAASPSAPPAAGVAPQVTAVAPSPPPSTLSRPSPEVCRNTLLDKLGAVGVAHVRAMAKVRFTEAAIEGKVPNTNNLRLDLRGSACGEDPRVKATLYDFDANEMLQSITYVWERPPGPAPAPIFNERISALSRFHALPPAQSPGRLQANTSLGRLIVQDMPERGLLLEAYAAPR